MRTDQIFGPVVPIVAMVHLPPLPGSPRWRGSMDEILEHAASEASLLQELGFDALLVENFGDVPFHPGRVPAETIAALTLGVHAVRGASSVPVGVNVLRNDAASALGIAAATGAAFVRINVHTGGMFTDQGWIAGRAHETLRIRASLCPRVAILADVLVKHATPPNGLTAADAARDAWDRGLADGLIVTGAATGSSADAARLNEVRTATPDAPLWLGSGLTPENVGYLLPLVNGAIVGSALREAGRAGRPLDRDRAERLLAAVQSVR